MKITADVLLKLRRIPNAIYCSEDELVQMLVDDPSLRYKKEALRIMVKEYQLQNRPKIEATKKEEEDVLLLDKGSKKKKKLENDFRYEPKLGHGLDYLGGIDGVKQQIENYVFLPIEQKLHFQQLNVKPLRVFLLVGSRGTGKTKLGLSILADIKRKHALTPYYVTSEQLLKDAEQTFQRLFKSALQNQPAIVFIDDIHDLCTKDNKKQSSAMNMLSSWLDRTDDEDIMIIGSTSAPESVDMLLKRTDRFGKAFMIENPNEDARTGILEKLLEGVSCDVKGKESEISVVTGGYVAADLVALVKEAAQQCVLRCRGIPTEGENGVSKTKAKEPISSEDFKNALILVEPLCKREGFTMIPDVTFDDVGALGPLKDQLIKSIINPIKYRKEFKTMNVPLSAGLLLYGPPGCGKTMLAKAIANAAKASFITVKGPELLSKYVGESEESVRKVFQRAKASAPCIIFFDEFDALAPKRQDQGNQVTQRVVNTLLNELNGVEDRKMIFVIAATNRPDIIDEAILRSGRIEKHLLVPLPTQEDRLSILKAIVRKINVGNEYFKLDPEVKLEDISKHTLCEGFSGADLHHLVKEACTLAITSGRNQLTQQDLLRSLDEIVETKRKIG